MLDKKNFLIIISQQFWKDSIPKFQAYCNLSLKSTSLCKKCIQSVKYSSAKFLHIVTYKKENIQNEVKKNVMLLIYQIIRFSEKSIKNRIRLFILLRHLLERFFGNNFQLFIDVCICILENVGCVHLA